MVAETEDIEDESLAIDCPVLVTERLVLRAPRESDIPALVRARRQPPCRADAGAHAASLWRGGGARLPRHDAGRGSAGVGYALTLAGTGTFIGCAGLNAKDRGLELGYWIGEPYWKRGYATEAAHALVDLAFRATGDFRAACVGAGHQPGVAAGHPQMRLPVCRPGHAELDRRRPGAGRALPARPQDLGEPEELVVNDGDRPARIAPVSSRHSVSNQTGRWSEPLASLSIQTLPTRAARPALTKAKSISLLSSGRASSTQLTEPSGKPSPSETHRPGDARERPRRRRRARRSSAHIRESPGPC